MTNFGNCRKGLAVAYATKLNLQHSNNTTRCSMRYDIDAVSRLSELVFPSNISKHITADEDEGKKVMGKFPNELEKHDSRFTIAHFVRAII